MNHTAVIMDIASLNACIYTQALVWSDGRGKLGQGGDWSRKRVLITGYIPNEQWFEIRPVCAGEYQIITGSTDRLNGLYFTSEGYYVRNAAGGKDCGLHNKWNKDYKFKIVRFLTPQELAEIKQREAAWIAARNDYKAWLFAQQPEMTMAYTYNPAVLKIQQMVAIFYPPEKRL